MKEKSIIAIGGEIGSGKDTTAQIFSALLSNSFHSRKRTALADKVKLMLSNLIDIPLTLFDNPNYTEAYFDFTRSQKSLLTKTWSKSVGVMLQHFATEVMRDNWRKDIWIKALENRLNDPNELNLIPDMRFLNEFEYFTKREDALLVRTIRAKNDILKEDSRNKSHRSEIELNSIPDSKFDIVIDNSSDLLSLVRKIEDCCVEFNLINEVDRIDLDQMKNICVSLQ